MQFLPSQCSYFGVGFQIRSILRTILGGNLGPYGDIGYIDINSLVSILLGIPLLPDLCLRDP